MILKGINGQSLEIKISNYQFTDEQKNLQDIDWLNILIDVKSDFGNWQTVDPSLTVSEFKEVISWFRDMSLNKKIKYPELTFTEPNLEFDYIKNKNGRKYIRVIFSAESKPISAKDGQEYFVDFQFSDEELSEIANELEVELNKIVS